MEGLSDSDDWVKASRRVIPPAILGKRRRGDLFDVSELMSDGSMLPVVKVMGKRNGPDAGTKDQSFETSVMDLLRQLCQGKLDVDYAIGEGDDE